MAHEAPLSARLSETLARVETRETGFGAEVAVARDGLLIGRAWVGEAAPGRAWTPGTPVVTWSVSKGVAAMVVARLARDGALDPFAPIRDYWPGFGQGGAPVTLADVMTHRAGLPWLPDRPGMPDFADPESWDAAPGIAEALAEMAPVAEMVGKVGYHALTYGWLVGECVHRATGASLDDMLQSHIATPSDLRMSFGTRAPETLAALARPGIPEVARDKALAVDAAFADPDNALRRSLCVPVGDSFAEVLRTTQSPAFLAAETPAISLVSDAGSLARAYSLFASAERVGAYQIIDSLGRDAAIAQLGGTRDDLITGGARNMALGFALNSPPSIALSRGARCFGHPGMGGSLAWGDPDSGLGFAYLTNAAIPDTVTDPRAVALADLAWQTTAEDAAPC
ncbi:serine hydrolase domain-containing protein [Roseisalinus antarcticus]|uniref:Beta-lactamase n=1 Tax=Roseisalinus antarcticus TaxID=254357 RepID=A0A1Y5RUY6_9RHOB|nr:serine hydrolase domain-containing protein [Roseisalinus antarcticus]SLN23303.1 Beta-lactamase [Roseisalinus antarcticus]